MRALHILLLICIALAGCAPSGWFEKTTVASKLLVTIRYDAVDSLQGNAGDRYRRPSSYGAGPGAGPLLDALAAEYSITRCFGLADAHARRALAKCFATARVQRCRRARGASCARPARR